MKTSIATLIFFHLLICISYGNEREIGVPDFPYDPDKKKETIILCTKICLKKKDMCYRSEESSESTCEGIFISCINSCR